MCGLTACLDYQKNSHLANDRKKGPCLEEEVEASLELVKNRGPDARGKWISKDGRVALGHVRLSIIDLSPDGNQPFHDSQNDIHAVVNGELYGYEKYRHQLSGEHQFKGNSDCEIVIALYKHYGLSFVSHLRGEFAYVLYDAKNQVFLAGRDRYGIKSLYYTIVDGRLLVATEMKSFLAFGWKPEWDIRSLREGGHWTDDRTLFKGVYKVLPAHYLSVTFFGRLEQKPYWDLDYPDKNVVETRTEEEMILGVRERLVEAVRLRLRADVPIAVYLSGGLDSSSVAGIIAHLIKTEGTNLGSDGSHKLSNLSAFTVQFDKDSGVNESEVAERTAKWLGIKFNPVYMDEETIVSQWEQAAWASECPLPDVDGASKQEMASRVHSMGIKVVLTGEGSDEHFAGYTSYHSDLMLEPDRSWPALLMDETKRKQVLKELAHAPGQINWVNETAPSTSTARMLNHTRHASRIGGMIPLHFAPWTDAYATRSSETSIAASFDGRVRDAIANKWHPLHTSEYTWTKTAFPNILLRYTGDNVDMTYAVESRTPFLDHHLTEYANSIPPSLKMKYNPATNEIREKHILREAVRPFITDEVYNRKKAPFLGPTLYRRGGPFHRLLSRLVTRENVDELLGFVDWREYENLMDKAFDEGGKDDPRAMRQVMALAHFVTLARRFGVKKAEPEDASLNGDGKNGYAHGGYRL